MDYRDSKRPTLTSTVLLDAVPIEDQECNVGPGESPTALGIHVPADQDPSQFLLYQWTKPSEPNTMEEQTEKDSNNDAIYGMPPLFSNTYRHAYSNLVSQCESEVVMEMESFSRKLAESFKKSMSELHLKKEQNKASLSNQLEEVQKAAEADRTALEAQRALEMNNFEIQLIHKENKENTINSIRLEIETSYTNFEARVRERPAASETLQPFLAHIKGLEDRLSAENERLNELQITLADAKRRVREEFTAKLADIERIKSDKETMTMKDNEEQFRRLDEEHRGLAETLATYSNDISELQGQWLSLVQGVQKYTDLEESDSGYETSPDELKSAPSWLDEDLDDAETELGGDQEHSDGHDSDKIPEEENTPRSPPNGKSQHSPDARQNGFVPPDVSLDEQINDDEVCSGQKKQERSMERSHCHRQAWKAPLPFQSGTNILSHILSLNIEQLWFKASRDEYKFYLGSRPEPFYTVELVPEDLRNFQTAKFEWTVLHKAWANDSALRALGLGFVYKEDSDGHVWIQKELSWVSDQHDRAQF
ncbi:uncharacterized protein LY89DRAFT_375984 [Mollisia scopiformis]|uniref:Uncharacterized protein n=1 Tax=Mollisia scopiformis TaxID=149040 RepID=A0A132B3T3_MOLSC|nr:uncharacterized protein LY89DRAFT_375984 [Mollisia scopiformis]KUJ07050.1 hypothetical protein LY89DRAFT_375984 [Mollisia scopiformis]